MFTEWTQNDLKHVKIKRTLYMYMPSTATTECQSSVRFGLRSFSR